MGSGDVYLSLRMRRVVEDSVYWAAGEDGDFWKAAREGLAAVVDDGSAQSDQIFASGEHGDLALPPCEPAKANVNKRPTSAKRINPDAVLLTLEEAAELLGTTADQVRAFIEDGVLRWVNLGRGKKRARYRVRLDDLDDFIAARTTQEAALCPSTHPRNTKASTSSTSKSKVIGFTARRAVLLAAKQKR